jgi:hypothetical protein
MRRIIETELGPLVVATDTKPLQGDDFVIEIDEDGDPIIPACLDREVTAPQLT